jgi:hypothetical protein
MNDLYKNFLKPGLIGIAAYGSIVATLFLITTILTHVDNFKPGSGRFLIPIIVLSFYPGILMVNDPDALLLIFMINIFCYFIFGIIIGLIVQKIKQRKSST